MEPPPRRSPKRRDGRVILQFDYDCFYAQVHENKNPALKSKPVGVKQKNILATCNYSARSHGVRKLMLVSEARKICPGLVLVEGEDLTPFRDVSKMLFSFFKSHSWNGKVERLGLDEVFMDVTDIVEYNMMCLNRNVLANSFFYLSKKDPERGFTCDLTAIAGCVQGRDPGLNLDEAAYVRLLLGSHLARYLRTKLEEDFGYTSTCGISTNKLLSKLAGAKNKPRNQTTLLALEDQDVAAFMDAHTLRSIPGIGFRTASLLETYMTGKESAADSHSFKSTVTAGDVRSSPKVSPGTLENILGGPGAERGIGSKTWALLHGVDPTEVKEARDIPSQISIEDTYGSGLGTMPQITEELHKLSYSLIRRMRVDLLAGDSSDDRLVEEKRWLARPRTLRLSIRSWHQMQSQSYNRSSRSGILPSFVFDLNLEIEHLAERLVVEGLLPLLRRLQNEKGPKWNLQLINICVANMVLGAADDKPGVGRDIANMFRNQDEALRPWKVVSSPEVPENDAEDATSGGTESEGDWETTANASCPQCGYSIPSFALPAHLRYHDMED